MIFNCVGTADSFKNHLLVLVYVTGTCKLPMGTTVMLGVLDAHRNTDLWEDPLKFDPDRFLSERVAKRHPYSYVPFSAGSRDCLGCKNPTTKLG